MAALQLSRAERAASPSPERGPSHSGCVIGIPQEPQARPGPNSMPRACGSQRGRSSLRNQIARHKRGHGYVNLNCLFLIISACDMNVIGPQNLGLIAERGEEIHELFDAAGERFGGHDLAVVLAY